MLLRFGVEFLCSMTRSVGISPVVTLTGSWWQAEVCVPLSKTVIKCDVDHSASSFVSDAF
jgi:hypothetical protein